jgi:transposase
LVTSALTLAEHAAAEATRLRAEMVRRVLDQPALAWLWSLDGIGPWTAVVIWAWIGDPHRFRHARPGTRYAGGDPSVHQSGEADGRGRISRQGPAVWRHALLEAAWPAIRRVDGPWRAFYDRVVGRLGSRRALVAVARKLLVAAWRIGRDARWAHEMDPDRYHTKVQRIRRTMAQQPPYPLRDRLAQWGVQPVIPPAAAEA